MIKIQPLIFSILISVAAPGHPMDKTDHRSKFEMFFYASKNIFQVVALDEHITETRVIIGKDTIIRPRYNTAFVEGRVFDIDQNVGKREALSWYTGRLSINEIYKPVKNKRIIAQIRFENSDGIITEKEKSTITLNDGTFKIAFDTSDLSHKVRNLQVNYFISGESYAVRSSHIFQFRRKKPVAIVDIDKTIFDGGTTEYLYGSNYLNQPIKNAVELLKELSQTHQIVYITHRDVRLSLRTQMWLREKDFPIGPIILSSAWDKDAKDYLGNYLKDSSMSAIIHKSDAFKYVLDQGLNVNIALGDKFTDAHVYTYGGAKNIVIFRFKKGDSQYAKIRKLEAYSKDRPIEKITDASKKQRLFIVKKWDDLLSILVKTNHCKKLLTQK